MTDNNDATGADFWELSYRAPGEEDWGQISAFDDIDLDPTHLDEWIGEERMNRTADGYNWPRGEYRLLGWNADNTVAGVEWTFEFEGGRHPDEYGQVDPIQDEIDEIHAAIRELENPRVGRIESVDDIGLKAGEEIVMGSGVTDEQWRALDQCIEGLAASRSRFEGTPESMEDVLFEQTRQHFEAGNDDLAIECAIRYQSVSDDGRMLEELIDEIDSPVGKVILGLLTDAEALDRAVQPICWLLSAFVMLGIGTE